MLKPTHAGTLRFGCSVQLHRFLAFSTGGYRQSCPTEDQTAAILAGSTESNGGEAGFDHRDDSIAPYCEIRDVAIENPFYTYCANHPHRRPDRDPIPIGPITRYAGDGMSNDREVWLPSPDSEEVRQHLLEMLEELVEHASEDRYPIGPSLAEVVIRQLGEFGEERAEDHIRWISENSEGYLSDVAREALAQTTSHAGRSRR